MLRGLHGPTKPSTYMITLLSPAKTLDFENIDDQHHLTDHVFPKETMQLVRLLRKQKTDDLRQLMSISEKIASLNVDRYKTFKKDYAEGVSRAAATAFKGDVYLGLEAATLTADQMSYAQSHLRILSGLYGVLRPLDRMQPYRLEMGTRLANKQGTNLYHFWGDKISKALNKDCKETGASTILNLASNEYFKAIDQKKLKAEIITVNFKEERDGELKFISFNAKKARGLMARYVMQHQIESEEGLLGFDSDGYYYSQEHSSNGNLLFVR